MIRCYIEDANFEDTWFSYTLSLISENTKGVSLRSSSRKYKIIASQYEKECIFKDQHTSSNLWFGEKKVKRKNFPRRLIWKTAGHIGIMEMLGSVLRSQFVTLSLNNNNEHDGRSNDAG